MLKKAIAFALIILAIYWSFFALIPSKISDLNTALSQFSSARALEHLKVISKAPHYVGSKDHDVVREYLIKHLEDLGLETQVQEGYSQNKKWGSIVKPKNILARIKGSDNTQALLLLSHYDSKSHASYGASDDGAGIVTILEGLRAFLSEGRTPRNDIIILFSDAEELGLNGADLFVNHHPWAKDVGLVLNFEARGSGGQSYMLIETNGGNKNLVAGFKAANPDYPVANSLAYSIYKMLPNDTDLTYFREDGHIDGMNFAFIDDHFDYHTALDTYDRLDRNTLEHQGSYLMPLLSYFSEIDLSDMKSNDDYVYFNMPIFKLVSYPYTWIFPMLILAIVIFLALIVYGLKKERLNLNAMALALIPSGGVLLINGVLGYFGWKVLLTFYPQYHEILQGFPYNGYLYIWAFVLLSTALCLWLYHQFYQSVNTANLAVPPLLLWLMLCGILSIKLEGASFFIVPVYFGLLSLFVLVRQKHPKIILMAFLIVPMILILSPFIKMFPVGLGLKTIVASTLLVSLMFMLGITFFGFIRYKNRLAYALFLASLGYFGAAHLNSNFNQERPKPNSLVYLMDADENTAHWNTYDHLLDPWTKNFLTENPDVFKLTTTTFESKYGTNFSYSIQAPLVSLKLPQIKTLKDTVIGEERHLRVEISPQREINTLEFFVDTTNSFLSFNINGLEMAKEMNAETIFEHRVKNRLFSYIVTEQQPVTLDFAVPAAQNTSLEIFEVSFDLLTNTLFDVPERAKTMIPKPFVLNDAIIIKKNIYFE